MKVDKFKFYLRRFNLITNQYQYYFVDSNGAVQLSNTKTALTYSPKGWQDMELKWERGFTYHGVFTNYTNPFQFVKDGRKIIKSLYYASGVNAICELLVEKHTNLVSVWGYQTYYVGDIDFSRFVDEKDYTQVEILQQGFMANLRSKEATKFEIPVTASPDYWVKLDGYPLQGQAEWSTGADVDCQTANPSTGAFYYPLLSFYFLGGYNPFLSLATQAAFTAGQGWSLITNTSNTETIEVTLTYEFYINSFIQGSAPAGIYYLGINTFVSDLQNTIISNTNRYTDTAGQLNGTSKTNTGTITFTETLPPSTILQINYGMYTAVPILPSTTTLLSGAWAASDVITGSRLKATWAAKVPDTYVPCITQQTLGTALVNKIVAGEVFNSDVAQTTDGYLLTCGDALRNLDDAVIKTSFNDFYNAMNAMHNIGMRYDNAGLGCVFELKSVIYDKTFVAINVGKVNNIKIEPLVGEITSGYKLGYKNYDYDTINGKEEFNIEYEWQTSINRVQNIKDIISPYRADMYGIELTRANLSGKKNSDSEADNGVFWLHADLTASAGTIPAGFQGAGQPYYELYRDNTLTITGLLYPSDAYNIEFSPKRRMFAHGDYIKSVLYNILSSNLSFTSSSKTQDAGVALSTDDGATIIDEKANEQVSGLSSDIIFYAITAEMDIVTPINIKELFDATIPSTPIPTVHALIEFEYNGNTYEGFCLMITEQPTWRPKQKIKLILSPNTDLNDLLNGI